ncbi:MAG: patatin-like phospholipase family protein [Bacillota bacterium]
METTIGLALGAGSARGLAHIGVLQAFREQNIEIDYIAGTSVGSIIGGFYCAGVDLHMLERLATHLEWDHLTDITLPREGLIAGNKMKEFFQMLTKQKKFSELETPFVAVATDIERGEEVVIDSGLVAEGLRASMSVPGVFVPYRLNDKLLVDGALLNRVPTSEVKELGADIVIGVDVTPKLVKKRQVEGIFDVIINSIDIMQQELTQSKRLDADLLIVPKVENVGATELSKAEECIKLGYQAAQEKIGQVKKIISRRTQSEEFYQGE